MCGSDRFSIKKSGVMVGVKLIEMRSLHFIRCISSIMANIAIILNAVRFSLVSDILMGNNITMIRRLISNVLHPLHRLPLITNVIDCLVVYWSWRLAP